MDAAGVPSVANRESSREAFLKARFFFDEGDTAKCRKLLVKSLQLSFSHEADTMLKSLEECATELAQPTSYKQPSTVGSSGNAADGQSSAKVGSRRELTDEEAVQRLLNKSMDHYQKLCIRREASPEDMKKAFRKLSLLVHPDKCSHPKAADAFTGLKAIYETLKDPSNQAQYDQENPPRVNRDKLWWRLDDFNVTQLRALTKVT